MREWQSVSWASTTLVMFACGGTPPSHTTTTPASSSVSAVNPAVALDVRDAQRVLELETRVALLESDNDRLRHELADAQAAVAVPEVQVAVAPEPVREPARVSSEPRPVLRLYGPIVQPQAAVQGLPQQPVLPGTALPSLGVVTRPGLSPPSPWGAREEAGVMAPSYRRALELLSARNFSEALPLLDAFVREDPHHPHADNALLWKGDALAALARHREAIRVYEQLVTNYPASALRSRVLQRTAEAYDALGEGQRARALYQQASRPTGAASAAPLAASSTE